MAMSRAKALSMAAVVTMSRGRGVPAWAMATMRLAASRQSLRRFMSVARIVPLPGSARPIASQRQFIELAVNMPEQEPAPGQAPHSTACSSSASIFSFLKAETASKTEIRSRAFAEPGTPPAAMGPPLAKIVGMLARRVPISMPGTTLSQFGMQMTPSKQWALIIDSTESAISSRLGSE